MKTRVSTNRLEMTVQGLARSAGVSVRTLHYYDEIGLLKPSRISENGYRWYGEQEALRLQQILFFKELDVPLDDIRRIVGAGDFSLKKALLGHRERLLDRRQRLDRLLQTIEATLKHVQGEQIMQTKQFFTGFSEAEQEAMAAEAETKYDSATVRQSQARWKAYSKQQKAAIMQEAQEIYSDFAKAMHSGIPASDEANQALVKRWASNIAHFWQPQGDQYLALAQTYVDDPRFTSNIDQLGSGLSAYILAAVKAHQQLVR